MNRHREIDELIEKRERKLDKETSYTPQMQKVIDNSMFMQKVRDEPVKTKKFDKKIFGRAINLNTFLNMRLWPRSFYKTDHLIRLGMGARYEILKRNIPKRRKASFDSWWLLILIGGVCAGIILIILVLSGLDIPLG